MNLKNGLVQKSLDMKVTSVHGGFVPRKMEVKYRSHTHRLVTKGSKISLSSRHLKLQMALACTNQLVSF